MSLYEELMKKTQGGNMTPSSLQKSEPSVVKAAVPTKTTLYDSLMKKTQGGTSAVAPTPTPIQNTPSLGKQVSAAHVAGEEIAYGVVPGTAAIAGGAAAATAAAPLAAVPVAGPFLVIGAVLAGAVTAGYLADKAQKGVISAVAGKEKAAQMEQERAEGQAQHPYAAFGGSLIPQLVAMKPSAKNVISATKWAKTLLATKDAAVLKSLIQSPTGQKELSNLINVSVGGGVSGGQELISQIQSGNYDAAKLAASTFVGTVINEPTKFGVKLGLHPTTRDVTIHEATPTPEVNVREPYIKPGATEIKPRTGPMFEEARVTRVFDQEATKYKTAEEFVNGLKNEIKPVYKEQGIIDVVKTEQKLPLVRDGYERFYRAESPTIKHGEVWDENKMTIPKGAKRGDSFWLTPDLSYADYYKQTYGSDAKISYFDLPKGLAKTDPRFEGEVFVNKSQLTDIYNQAVKTSAGEKVIANNETSKFVPGPGYKKVSGFVDEMVTNKTVSPEAGNIIKTVLEGTDDNYLAYLNMKEVQKMGNAYGRFTMPTLPRRRYAKKIADYSRADEHTFQMKKGLAFRNPEVEGLQVFFHEFGHAGYYLILDDAERVIVNDVFRALGKDKAESLFKEGVGTNTPHYVENVREFFAQVTSDYIVQNKVPDEKMRPLLQRIAGKFFDAIKRLVNRNEQGSLDKLKPLIEKILNGDKTTPLTAFADTEPPSFRAKLQAMFGTMERPVDKNANGIFVKPQASKQVPASSLFSSGATPPPPPTTPKLMPSAPGESDAYVASLVAKQESARKVSIFGKAVGALKEIKNKIVDFNAPIEDVFYKMEKEGVNIPIAEHISHQIDKVLRSPSQAGQFAKDNGMVDILQKVDNPDNLEQYMIAKQAKTVAAKGIDTGRNLLKDEKLIQDLAPRYESFAKQVTAYSQKLLDYSVNAGLISADLADHLKGLYPEYVPIKRIFNAIEKPDTNVGKSGTASLYKQTVVRKLVGSEREIEGPIYSLLATTNDAFRQGEKNIAAGMLVARKDAPGNPFQLRKIGPGESADNFITWFNKGVKETYATTKEVSDAARALNVQQFNAFMNVMAVPVRALKLGTTTLKASFFLANIIKDQVTAFINSDYAVRSSILNPMVFTKALFEVFHHGKLYEEIIRAGGGGTSFDISRSQIPQSIERIRAGRSLGSKILYTVKTPAELLRAVENLIGRSEEFTRTMQYLGTKEGSIAKGMSPEDAKITAARAYNNNTVNFARRGEFGSVLNAMVPYLNAGIQGTRTFVRTMKAKPVQTGTKVALLVFAPVATATVWNLSDPKRKEAYDDVPEWEKKLNIIITSPDPKKNANGEWNTIKIPLSQEINSIASLPRRFIEQAYGLDPVAIQDISNALIGSVSPIEPNANAVLSALTPQILKPSIEASQNRVLFTGFPIVSSKYEKLSPSLQAKPNTSGTVRKIAQPLNLSPIQVEQWIKGTFGGLSSEILNASDRILAGLDIIPKDQIGGTSTTDAIIDRFYGTKGGNIENRANAIIEKIVQEQTDNSFRLKQEAEILYTELRAMPPEEANAKALELSKANPALFEKLKTVFSEAKKGLDYGDRLMLQLQVENGQRAKFIWESLKSFKTPEEKTAYYNGLVDKGIITKNIVKQLKQLQTLGL